MANKPKKVRGLVVLNTPPQEKKGDVVAERPKKMPVIKVYNDMGRCVGTRPDPSSLSLRARDWNAANDAVGRPWTFLPESK
jgi:hypothetical protein